MIAGSSKGEFRQQSLDSPFVAEIGDQALVTGGTITFLRNGVVVGVRHLTGIETAVPLGNEQQQVIDKIIFFKGVPIVGQVATLIDVVKNTTTGSLRFVFSNGDEREFVDAAEAMSTTDAIDTTPELAQNMLIRKTLFNSPDQTNLRTCVGGKCSIDMNANNPVTLTIE